LKYLEDTAAISYAISVTIKFKLKLLNMAPPSKIAIATGSVLRLVKEEASYHKEIAQQEERITKLEASAGDENKEYTLKQEVSCSSRPIRFTANYS
jgi:hypothetical protein